MKFPKMAHAFMCLLLFFSCSQSLDFDQIEDYTTAPVFSSALTFFTINSSDFITAPGTPAETEIEEETDFRIFENSIIKNNLVRLDFNFEAFNTFDRDFTMEISLLDNNDRLIYKLQDLKITANITNFKQVEVIDITSNSNVKNLIKVVVKLSLDDKSTPIDASVIGELKFKSAAIIYLETSL